MISFPDHYAALGIDPTADQEVITAAYRALAKKFHPDTGGNTGTASPERFDQVQKAYEVLRTPESRHAYDLELLAATEAELEAHLAAKRRIVPVGAEPKAGPPPDLGEIRPEPAARPGSAGPRGQRRTRPLFPYLVPVLLLLGIALGGAWLFLPKSPEAPPLPEVATAPATPPAPAPVSKPAAVTEAARPAAAVERPLFGSTGSDGEPPAPQQTAAASAAVPVPPVPAAKPVFGSTGTSEQPALAPGLPAADEPAPPLPKAKPAVPPRQVQQQAAQPSARVKLQYQDPPQYSPPSPRLAGDGPYRLVIFERQPGQDSTAWSAGVMFDSEGSCTRFGVKAVLRRTANRDASMEGTKVWYECQPAPALQ